MSKDEGPRITIDVKFLQPGDVVKSIVDDAFQVTVARPSLKPAGHMERKLVMNRRNGNYRMTETLCHCSIGHDHRAEDLELTAERKAEQERRRAERAEQAWLR